MADLSHLLAIYVHAHQTGNAVPPHIDADARAALAAEPPAPAQAADGEREELAQWLEGEAEYYESLSTEASAKATRAAAMLRQPAPAPVPVAERPWERPGWCDAEGCLWLWDSDRRWVRQTGTAGGCNTWTGSFALPHWAILQPPQDEEVEE